MSKFCPKCQTETERYASGRCKPCSMAYLAANSELNIARCKAWYAANKERRQEYEKTPEQKAKRAACRAANPELAKTAVAAWRAANPEAARIINQNRRARKRENGGILSKGLSDRLFKLQKGKCTCCNQPLGTDYHLDHVLPLALGGTNTDGNIQLLRQQCNNQKHTKHPVDFMQSRGFLL